jgi:hypothetical protein
VLLVRVEKLEFEVKREYLTNDLDVADFVARNDEAVVYNAKVQQEAAAKEKQEENVAEMRRIKEMTEQQRTATEAFERARLQRQGIDPPR